MKYFLEIFKYGTYINRVHDDDTFQWLRLDHAPSKAQGWQKDNDTDSWSEWHDAENVDDTYTIKEIKEDQIDTFLIAHKI